MEKRNQDGLTEKEFLKQYNPGNYEKPSVTVDIMLLRTSPDLKTLQILLIKRKDHPYIDQWALPGGFMDITESSYQAACRELKEKTNIDVKNNNIYLEQIYTMTNPKRDPRMRIVDIAYAALIPYGTNITPIAGDDAKEALWFDTELINNPNGIIHLQLLNQTTNTKIKYRLKNKTFHNGVLNINGYKPMPTSKIKLAFDHVEIILEELIRLCNKAVYTDIAFNLVPKKFTLPDIQRVYELLIGKALYKTNFKRDIIGNKIEKLNEPGKSITSNKTIGLYQYKGDKL